MARRWTAASQEKVAAVGRLKQRLVLKPGAKLQQREEARDGATLFADAAAVKGSFDVVARGIESVGLSQGPSGEAHKSIEMTLAQLGFDKHGKPSLKVRTAAVAPLEPRCA